jgi:hypothetical protein
VSDVTAIESSASKERQCKAGPCYSLSFDDSKCAAKGLLLFFLLFAARFHLSFTQKQDKIITMG